MATARSKWKEKLDESLEDILNYHLKPFADYPRVFATIAGSALAVYSGAVESYEGVFQYVNKAFSPDSVMVDLSYWGFHALLGSIAGFYVGHTLGKPLAKYLHQRGCYSIFKLPKLWSLDAKTSFVNRGLKNSPGNHDLEKARLDLLKERVDYFRETKFKSIREQDDIVLEEIVDTGFNSFIYQGHLAQKPEEKMIIKINTTEPLVSTTNTERLSKIPLRERLSKNSMLELQVSYARLQEADVSVLSQVPGYGGVDEKRAFIWRVYPDAGLSLDRYIAGLSEQEKDKFILPYFFSLVNEVRKLHNAGLVHRDIKPGNLYVKKVQGKYHALLGDTDTITRDEEIRQQRNAETPILETIGSPAYMAPEGVQDYQDWIGGKAVPFSVDWKKNDVFELGIVLYRLILGSFPFVDGSADERSYAIWRLSLQKEDYGERLAKHLTKLREHPFHNVFAGCLNPDQTKRWDVGVLYNAVRIINHHHSYTEFEKDLRETRCRESESWIRYLSSLQQDGSGTKHPEINTKPDVELTYLFGSHKKE